MGKYEKWSASKVLVNKFGRLTGFVHDLARRLLESERVRGELAELLSKRKRPVLVVVEPDGEFNVYADDRGVSVEVVHIPHGEWKGSARTLVERYVDAVVSDRHAAIHLPSRWVNKGSAKLCPTVSALIDRAITQGLHETLGGK